MKYLPKDDLDWCDVEKANRGNRFYYQKEIERGAAYLFCVVVHELS